MPNFFAVAAIGAISAGAQPTPKPPPRAAPPYVNLGTVDAVEDLLERQLPGSKGHFQLELAPKCPGSEPPCFALADGDGGTVKVTATGASELASGVGHYLREFCNMTIGWKRGGGSNLFVPTAWPKIGKPVARRRNTPWSYFMNVCTCKLIVVRI